MSWLPIIYLHSSSPGLPGPPRGQLLSQLGVHPIPHLLWPLVDLHHLPDLLKELRVLRLRPGRQNLVAVPASLQQPLKGPALSSYVLLDGEASCSGEDTSLVELDLDGQLAERPVSVKKAQ